MKQNLHDKEFESKRALWPFIKQIFGYSFKYKKWFTLLSVSVIIVAVADAVFPLIWLHFIDNLITPLVTSYQAEGLSSIRDDDLNGLLGFGGIYLGWSIIQIVGIGFFVYYARKIQEYVIYDLRKEMFNKLQRLSFSYYDKSAIGWLISRITSDTGRVTELISWGFISLVWGVFMIIFCFSAMAFYNWKLMMIVLVSIPFLLFISVKIRLLILRYARRARKVHSEMIANFNEHVHGIEVNKVTAQEDRASKAFGLFTDDLRGASFRAAYYSALFSPLVIIIGSIAAAMVIYFGGHQTLAENGITIGMLAAFISYATMIYDPILDIARFYAMAQNSLSAGERIFSLIQEDVEIVDPDGAPDYGEIEGKIGFENLDFHYVEGQPILTDLNLRINAGESIALVGPTGEGKTTIASVIARFYQPTGGAVKIDDVDYRERTLHSFRSQLGVILQTPHVFSGTLIENIRYGNFEATEAEIKAVLASIGADELIPRLHEQIGEEGGTLSLGEKQLISFARVILKDPKILIMDEATSSVDTLAEMKIQRGIEQLVKGRTSIIIAHRLSTIRNCDRILVIRKGQILEQGSHQELLDERGFYYQLYTRQSRKRRVRKVH